MPRAEVVGSTEGEGGLSMNRLYSFSSEIVLQIHRHAQIYTLKVNAHTHIHTVNARTHIHASTVNTRMCTHTHTLSLTHTLSGREQAAAIPLSHQLFGCILCPVTAGLVSLTKLTNLASQYTPCRFCISFSISC